MMRSSTRTPLRVLTVVVFLAGAAFAPGATHASAQNPAPTLTAESRNDNVYPSSIPFITVVQGDPLCEKSGGNAGGLSQLENISNQLLGNGKATISEITINAECGSDPNFYASEVRQLVNYIESRQGDAAQRWLGVMLDEESGYGISVSTLVNLNGQVKSIMSGTAGISWYFTEGDEGQGDWGLNAYKAVVGNGAYPAPQIPNSYMVSEANNSGFNPQLVTWSTVYPSPYNNQAASVNAVRAAPYQFCGYSTGCSYYSNRFIPS